MDNYVLLWSQSQGAFHVEPLNEMFESNAKAFAANRRMDYVPLHIGTDNACFALADKLRPLMAKRENLPNV